MRQKVSITLPSYFIYLIFLLSQIFFSFKLQSKELTQHEIKTAIETWVRQVTTDARPDAVIEKLESLQKDGTTVAYIAHLLNGGFCLCGANELVLPVYLYSPKGKYNPENPNYQYILWEIETRLKFLQRLITENDQKAQTYQVSLTERSNFWNDLKNGITPTRKILKTEELLSEPNKMIIDFTPNWDQHSPYNEQCPELTPGADEHTVAGCVATAMSQIMYYWKWPNTGKGKETVTYKYKWRDNWDEESLSVNPYIPPSFWSNRLQWTASGGGRLRMNGCWDETVLDTAQKITTNSNYQTVLKVLYNRLPNIASNNYSANFGSTTYNWNLMQDWHYQWDSFNDSEVAKLCFHVGVAVGMNYGLFGSGTEDFNIPIALIDHFTYNADARLTEKDINKMTEEIQWLRPVVLIGYQTSNSGGKDGHAWVVYGYDKKNDPNRQFKMNLGWGGDEDGWYSCDEMYSRNQTQVTRIAPENVKFLGGYGVDGSPDSPYYNLDRALSNAPDHSTLIFKAGSINTFSSKTIVINRPLIFKGYNVIIGK